MIRVTIVADIVLFIKAANTMREQSHLYQEIHQQPDVLANLLDTQRGAVEMLAEDIQARGISSIVLAARGTSDNAGRYARYLLGSMNGLLVTLATPSLYTIYNRPPRLDGTLVLGISQSGKSPDIVAVLAEARRQGALTAAITNFPRSDLARQAQHVIDLRAGLEESVAATKTYTAELATIALLSAALAGDAEMRAEVSRLPQLVDDVLAISEEIAPIAERYRYMRHCVVIGRGYNYATAFELALKVKELTYTVAEPYSSADFLHGPLAMIDEGFPAIVIAPSGLMLAELADFAQTLKQHGAELIAISDDRALLDAARVALPLPERVPEWLSPVPAIIPGQLFAMHLAFARDYDPDHPRSLHKVTETR